MGRHRLSPFGIIILSNRCLMTINVAELEGIIRDISNMVMRRRKPALFSYFPYGKYGNILVMVMVMVLVMVTGGFTYGQSCGVSGGRSFG